MRDTSTRIRVAVTSVAMIASFALIRVLWWTDSRGSRRYVLFDDAMISLSYARTLVRGGGLVWFEGAPRVQGITNPAWTILMSPWAAFSSVRAASLAISIVGVVVLAAVGWVVVSLADGCNTSTRVGLGLLVVLHFPLVYWTIRGMEVGLVALIAVSSVALVTRGRSELALASLLAFGVLVRFDLVLVGFALALVAWWLEGRRVSRRVLVPTIAVATSAIVVLIAQKAYYGSWLPNTFRLKMSGGPISDRLAAGLDSVFRHPYAVIFGIAAMCVAPVARRAVVWRLAAIALVYEMYNVWVGGDSWEQFANRYHAVATPLAAVALVLALEGEWVKRRGLVIVLSAWASVAQLRVLMPARVVPDRVASLAMCLVLVAFVVMVGRMRSLTWIVLAIVIFGSSGWILDIARSRAFDHEADVTRVEKALVVREITTPDAVIAVVSAGTNVYVADRPAVDLLGKSDERIASLPRRIEFFPGHDKWDLAMSLVDPRPDLVLEEVDPRAPEILIDAGYQRMCAGRDVEFWVANDSTRVDRNALVPC